MQSVEMLVSCLLNIVNFSTEIATSLLQSQSCKDHNSLIKKITGNKDVCYCLNHDSSEFFTLFRKDTRLLKQ